MAQHTIIPEDMVQRPGNSFTETIQDDLEFEQSTIMIDYVFETPTILPEGNWTLTIEKGDAWIFCRRGNFSVNANQTVKFDLSDGAICIRQLYTAGFAKYRAKLFS